MKNRNRRAITAAVVFVCGAGIYLTLVFFPLSPISTAVVWLADSDGMPRVIAHQGGAQEVPSQTNLAFEYAASIGVDVFELDVVLTADDQLAVIHDLTVDRTTDGSGLVADMTYEEIRALDAGYGLLDSSGRVIRDPSQNPFIGRGAYIPSLQELFQRYPEQPMLIEIKDTGERGRRAAEVFWKLVQEYQRAETVVAASFSALPLKHLHRISDGVLLQSAAADHVLRFYALHLLRLHALNSALPFQVLNLPSAWDVGPFTVDLLSGSLREDIRNRGMALHYWTINDEDEMRDLIAMGVDGIITDRPSLLIAIIEEMRSSAD
ncbi:MAG: glycerophosphodiester phosphodiesterase [Spirochaeta sp.]